MAVEHVEILVEEPSMEAFLRELLPRALHGVSFEVYPFQSKQDMLEKLPSRLQGYSHWLPPSWGLIVLVDCDGDSCVKLKRKLEKAADGAGLLTRSRAESRSYRVVNRIVIEELEAWYFGDWKAVRTAYPKVSKSVPAQARYRDPDAVAGGTWEVFERILQRAGYFRGGLRKIEAARILGGTMDPLGNRSRSFQTFWRSLIEMTAVRVGKKSGIGRVL